MVTTRKTTVAAERAASTASERSSERVVIICPLATLPESYPSPTRWSTCRTATGAQSSDHHPLSRRRSLTNRLRNCLERIAVERMVKDRFSDRVRGQLHDDKLGCGIDVEVLVIEALGFKAAVGVVGNPPVVMIGVAVSGLELAGLEFLPVAALADFIDDALWHYLTAIDLAIHTQHLAKTSEVTQRRTQADAGHLHAGRS